MPATHPSGQGAERRPRLLDLFCGAGGCSVGYARAGFDVIGVDIAAQPNYPFEFIQADALDVLAEVPADGSGWDCFDAIHASPPCQAYSPLNAYNGKSYPDLVGQARQLLASTGLPYVIENVVQAPLNDPVTLCGTMFGLRVYRHRAFETSFPLLTPPHPRHVARCVRNGYLPNDVQYMSIHGGRHSQAWRVKAAEVMGVPWMATIREVCEAIPPAYTDYVGQNLRAWLAQREELAA